MKSIHHGTAAANCKLRGKHELPLNCGCCWLINFKFTENVKQANLEIKNYYKD